MPFPQSPCPQRRCLQRLFAESPPAAVNRRRKNQRGAGQPRVGAQAPRSGSPKFAAHSRSAARAALSTFVRNARLSVPAFSARCAHAASGQRYAPRPRAVPVLSIAARPAAVHTILTRACLGFVARHPRHVRNGTCFPRGAAVWVTPVLPPRPQGSARRAGSASSATLHREPDATLTAAACRLLRREGFRAFDTVGVFHKVSVLDDVRGECRLFLRSGRFRFCHG